MYRKVFPIGIMIILAVSAIAVAHPTFTPRTETTRCQNSDTVHDYNALGSIQAGDRNLAAPGGGITSFQDGNLILQCSGNTGGLGSPGWSGSRGDAHPGDFDGDLEWGTSGGLFPATDSFGGQGIVSSTGAPSGLACDNGNPVNHAHHGTTYTVADVTGPGFFSIGSDDTTLGTVSPTTDAFDDDNESCDLADGAVTPDTDCDDYLTDNYVGSGSAVQGTGYPPSGLATTISTTVSGVINSLPAPVPATLHTVLSLVLSTATCTPPAAGTAFPVSYDGTYVIFISGAVLHDNTDATPGSLTTVPEVHGATAGHICNGVVAQATCLASA